MDEAGAEHHPTEGLRELREDATAGHLGGYGGIYREMYGEINAEIYGEIYGEIWAEIYGDVYAEIYGEILADRFGRSTGDMGDIWVTSG